MGVAPCEGMSPVGQDGLAKPGKVGKSAYHAVQRMRHAQATDKSTVFVSYRGGIPGQHEFLVCETHHGTREEFMPCFVKLGPWRTHKLGHLVTVGYVLIDVLHRSRRCFRALCQYFVLVPGTRVHRARQIG